MSLTVGLACGHGLQLRNGEDTHEENLPAHGPWTFYPLDQDDLVDLRDIITCLVCQTNQEIIAIVADRLIPMDDTGRLIL
jgi:hypothetical protein